MFRWAQCGFHKKHGRTRYAKFEFLHSVGSVGHKVHSRVSRVPNVEALFFKLGLARYSFHKKRPDTLCRSHDFASCGICGSRIAFQCVRCVKRRLTIFHGQVARCGVHKKRAGTHYVELVFLHPVGFVGHVVLSSAHNFLTITPI
jgi:hypothetical protein